jgi:beta-barrel assembly-enhancing protease
MTKRNSVFRAMAALLVAVMPTFAVAPTPELPDPGSASVSREDQIKVGYQAVQQVYQQMPVLPDSDPVSQYIQQLARKLTAQIPPEHSWPWQFHVVQESDINAFAVPGGPLFVNVGTITAADNEAELAGVMAHEISHDYMMHAAKAAGKQSWTQGIGAIAGAILGARSPALGQLAQVGAGLISLKYSRSDESQADAVGAIIMYKAGYNPQAMADFFQKLEQQGGSAAPQLLSDHPNPGNRQQAIAKEIQNWPQKNFVSGSAAFASARQRAKGIKSYTAEQIAAKAKSGGGWNNQPPAAGNNGGAQIQPASANVPASGVSRSAVMPSGSFQQLNGSVFSLQYPTNWKAAQSQQGGAEIAPEAGIVENGLAYGVIINGFQPQTNNLDEAVQNLVSAVSQDNPGLRANGSPQKIRVNGVEGRSVELTGNSPLTDNGKPARERDWLVALPRQDGSMFYMVFVAPDRDFNALRPTYESMLKSLRLQ